MEGSNKSMRRKRRNMRLYIMIKKEEVKLQIYHEEDKKQN